MVLLLMMMMFHLELVLVGILATVGVLSIIGKISQQVPFPPPSSISDHCLQELAKIASKEKGDMKM